MFLHSMFSAPFCVTLVTRCQVKLILVLFKIERESLWFMQWSLISECQADLSLSRLDTGISERGVSKYNALSLFWRANKINDVFTPNEDHLNLFIYLFSVCFIQWRAYFLFYISTLLYLGCMHY